MNAEIQIQEKFVQATAEKQIRYKDDSSRSNYNLDVNIATDDEIKKASGGIITQNVWNAFLLKAIASSLYNTSMVTKTLKELMEEANMSYASITTFDVIYDVAYPAYVYAEGYMVLYAQSTLGGITYGSWVTFQA
jgi:hypothetical protein